MDVGLKKACFCLVEFQVKVVFFCLFLLFVLFHSDLDNFNKTEFIRNVKL